MNVKVTNRHNQQQYSAIADYWGKELGWSFKIIDTRPNTWGRSLRGTGVGPVIDQGFQKELEQRGWVFPALQPPEDVRDKEMARLAASFKKPTAESIVASLLDHCGVCAADLKKRHAIGVDVEQEHTSDPKKASEIAATHEKENKLYYPLKPKPKNAKEALRWVKEDAAAGLNGNAPSEEKQMTLGEIFAVLPEEVQNEIMRLLNSEPDDIALTSALKNLLRPHAAALETVGIIPDYLAYMLLHVRNQMQ